MITSLLFVALSTIPTIEGIERIQAKAQRSIESKRLFVRTHPCPTTGSHELRHCPTKDGKSYFVIDHILPLCAGYPDTPANMQWQEFERSKKKDRVEVLFCKCLDRLNEPRCRAQFEPMLRNFK